MLTTPTFLIKLKVLFDVDAITVSNSILYNKLKIKVKIESIVENGEIVLFYSHDIYYILYII